MDDQINIVEDRFRILETDGRPMQVSCFPSESEVNVLVDVLNKYNPYYDGSVWRKSFLKKKNLIFEFFNRTDHFKMTQYTIKFLVCGVYGCHICGIYGSIFHTPVMSNGELHKEVLWWLDLPVVNPTYMDKFLSPENKIL